MNNFKICAPQEISFWWSNQEEWDGRDIGLKSGRTYVHIGLWWENLRERQRLEGLVVDVRTILQ
jgi:hypothetical protein